MKFEEKIKQVLNVNDGSLDESQFIANFHVKQREMELQRSRINSSLATAVFLILFGWASFSQLEDEYEMNDVYTYNLEFDFTDEIDSLDYDIYIDDLALYLVEEDDDIFSVLEFFNEVNYNIEINNEEIQL